jgi:hypothetical protein
MLASTVRIDAGFETNIRTVVIADYCRGPIPKELSSGKRIVLGIPFFIWFEMYLFKPIRRVAVGATRR